MERVTTNNPFQGVALAGNFILEQQELQHASKLLKN